MERRQHGPRRGGRRRHRLRAGRGVQAPDLRGDAPGPEEELRLNQPAELPGEARYYFGLPVTTGKVRLAGDASGRLALVAVVAPLGSTRQTPGWWRRGHDGPGRRRPVQGARSPPRRTSRAPPKELTCSLRARRRRHRRGRRDPLRQRRVPARLRVGGGPGRPTCRRFLLADQKASALDRCAPTSTARRAPARPAGRSSRSQQPGRTRCPRSSRRARRPTRLPERPPHAGRRAAAALEPRLPARAGPRASGRTARGRASGALQHDAKGVAALELPALAAGAYRLRYETSDDGGRRRSALAKELVVARPGARPSRCPGSCAVERSSVPVGGTARLLVHSGLAGQP